MKTFSFEFNEKELAVLRKVLGQSVLDLRVDEITYLRIDLVDKPTRK